MLKTSLLLVAFVVILYVCICLYIYSIQDNLLFFPRPMSDAARKTLEQYHDQIRDITIRQEDGVILKGWMVNETPKHKNVIFFFGWNNQEVSSMIAEATSWKDWMTVLINYRGYGESEWTPSEQGFYTDAEKIYDTVRPTWKIIIMWRSIGTGVATYLATTRKTDGVILVTPYDSITSVAEEKYPLLPMRLIAKYTFDSLAKASNIKSRLLSLIASRDTIIPPWHADRLFEKWWWPKQAVIVEWADHNSIVRYDEYKKEILEFLKNNQ